MAVHRLYKAWFNQTLRSCQHTLNLPRCTYTKDFLKNRISKAIIDLRFWKEKLENCSILDLEDLDKSYNECMSAMKAALSELNSLTGPSRAAAKHQLSGFPLGGDSVKSPKVYCYRTTCTKQDGNDKQDKNETKEDGEVSDSSESNDSNTDDENDSQSETHTSSTSDTDTSEPDDIEDDAEDNVEIEDDLNDCQCECHDEDEVEEHDSCSSQNDD